MFEVEKEIFPDFPRTQHLPSLGEYIPNATSDDKIAPYKIWKILAENDIYIEEKIDGANSGICHCPELNDNQPLIRNRNYILRKGYSRKNTPAKLQFTSIWSWYYTNIEKFKRLNSIIGFDAPVYGEWMYQQSSIFYDKLPSMFIAYDIWDYHNKRFISTDITRNALIEAGFSVPPLFKQGRFPLTDLLPLLKQVSSWAADEKLQVHTGNHRIEGLYLKVDTQLRYKMVRSDFTPGAAFSNELKKNLLVK